MKIWIDGSGLGHTAATTGRDGEVTGPFDDDPANLTRYIVDAHRAGWQVAAHAVGDAAVDLVLDALEEAGHGGPFAARGGAPPRHRLEHGVMFRADQVERLARTGMTVVTQPMFIADFGDPLLQLFEGGTGAGDYFRMRSLLTAGVPVVGSSDRPVAAGSPLLGIQEMVERTTAGDAVFGADERLTPGEALASYTTGGARAAHCEGRWGTLAPRLLADLVVLSDDPTAVAVDRIGSIEVMATVVGGRAAHDPDTLFDGATDG
jgi:predicted amidohydrolase YtcJ